jgi:hypothetical protein
MDFNGMLRFGMRGYCQRRGTKVALLGEWALLEAVAEQRVVLDRADVEARGCRRRSGLEAGRSAQEAALVELAADQSPASIAGLPGRSACVRVGPPLSASGPSSGLVLNLSLARSR